jgi:glycosyltransferase involved in cell wall biosynthesis
MMHVCHLCDGSLEGDYFRNMAAGLTEKGVRVSLLELAPGKSPTWLSAVPGISYSSLGASGKVHYPGAVRRLAQYLKDERVDILHTHLFYSGLLGVLTKRLNRSTQIALMRHHTSVVRMLGSRLHVAADKWMAMNADHVLTVSHAARDYMRDVDGITRKIDVVHLGFDFERVAPDRESRERIRGEFGFEEDDIVIGYVAGMLPGKGHLQLIEAYSEILQSLPNARLFLIGRGKLGEIGDAVGRLGLGRRITFAGWRNDVPACLNAMDIFIQPSLSEAFSQVIIEAMGTALPVIATDVGGASEVIESGVNGILIEPDNVPEIAEQAVRLGHDRALRMSLAAAARKTVVENFTADRMVDAHYELYRLWSDDKC